MNTEKQTSARVISIISFIFMLSVSTVIYMTEDNLGLIEYILIICAPPVLGVFSYFVVLHHDPNASD